MSAEIELSKQLVLGEILARWARKSPDKEALVFKDKRLTYRQFNERVNRLAHGLLKLGIGRGDKIAVIFMNCLEIVECYFALAKIGVVAVPLNFRFTKNEHQYQIDNSDARAVIYGSMFRDIIDSIRIRLPKVEHYICVSKGGIEGAIDYEALIRESSPGEPLIMVEDDDPAFIMYTSGTTGSPKGAVLTHKNQISLAINFCLSVREFTAKQLIVFPLFHQAATAWTIIGVFNGESSVILDDPTPEKIMAAIQSEKIECVGLVPALWNWIVNHPQFKEYDLSSLRAGGTGAAPIPVEVKKRIFELLPNLKLVEAFGQTETSATGTLAFHEDFLRKSGTVGKPRINVEARIVDPDGNDVPIGQKGEIVYRGPSVMKEYYKNPSATAEAFRGGWFHSGDMVRQDDEGYIYVVDRLKDMIISGGENIYPAEIENVLYNHPKILEAAVIGIPDPDWGESVKAYIVLKAGQAMTEAEVIDFCREQLASYKKPRVVQFIDALPRNASGKVLKTTLREMHRQKVSSAFLLCHQ